MPMRIFRHTIIITFFLTSLFACRIKEHKAKPSTQPSSRPTKSLGRSTPQYAAHIIHPDAPKRIVHIIKKSQHAVVTISTNTAVKNGPADWFSLEANTNPLDRTNLKLQQTLCSGVIISADGLILTSAKAIEKRKELFVTLENGKKYAAYILGTDRKLDIALLKLPHVERYPFLHLGDSSALELGEWLIGLSNPFGKKVNASVGIVSQQAGPTPRVLLNSKTDFLQTNLLIHRGNRGGPIINLVGEVIGLATMADSEVKGIGFILPSNAIEQLLPHLKSDKKTKKLWIGLYASPLNDSDQKRLKLKEKGVLITGTYPQGPADRAGLKKDDLIIRIGQKRIYTPADLKRAIEQAEGKSVALEYIREKNKAKLMLHPSHMPR